jgi:hypothetical protein
MLIAEYGIPAFAGMTNRRFLELRKKSSSLR